MNAKTYTHEAAAEILGVEIEEMSFLRTKIGISSRGPLSKNNLTAMKSYLEKVEKTLKESTTPDDAAPEKNEPEFERFEADVTPFNENDTALSENETKDEPLKGLHLTGPTSKKAESMSEVKNIDEVNDPTSLEDDELVTVTIGQIRELVSMIKGKMPRRAGTMELFYAAGA